MFAGNSIHLQGYQAGDSLFRTEYTDDDFYKVF